MKLMSESGNVCRAVATELRETVNLAVLDSGTAVNLTQDLDGRSVRVHNRIGRRTPLHATSSGKVLLAEQDPVAVETALAERVTDPVALRAELERVRRDGWAGTAGELEIGLNAVAVPVRGADGGVVGALSASGPGYRLTEQSFPVVARRLAAAAAEIGARLAAHGVPVPQTRAVSSG